MSVGDLRRVEEAFGDLEETYLASYRAAVDHAFRARESNARVTRNFFASYIALMEDHATLNERAAREALRNATERREAFLRLAEEGFTGTLPAGDEEPSRGS